MAGSHCLSWAVLLVFGIVACSSINGVVSDEMSCEGDFQGLREQCAPFVMKGGIQTPPSQACCDVIKKANVPCVCHYITKEIEAVIDVQLVRYVAAYCGNPIPSGTKCGSITIPSISSDQRRN